MEKKRLEAQIYPKKVHTSLWPTHHVVNSIPGLDCKWTASCTEASVVAGWSVVAWYLGRDGQYCWLRSQISNSWLSYSRSSATKPCGRRRERERRAVYEKKDSKREAGCQGENPSQEGGALPWAAAGGTHMRGRFLIAKWKFQVSFALFVCCYPHISHLVMPPSQQLCTTTCQFNLRVVFLLTASSPSENLLLSLYKTLITDIVLVTKTTMEKSKDQTTVHWGCRWRISFDLWECSFYLIVAPLAQYFWEQFVSPRSLVRHALPNEITSISLALMMWS